MFSDTRHLISTAEKAPGIVAGFERRSSKGGSTDYSVIEFVTASGPGDYAKGKIRGALRRHQPRQCQVQCIHGVVGGQPRPGDLRPLEPKRRPRHLPLRVVSHENRGKKHITLIW